MVCLYQPFMELWMGKRLMLNFSAAVCFGIYFFIRQINSLLNLYKDAAGMWHEDRFRPLVAALGNLVMNLILVRYIGIYGVILSTVLAIVLIGEPWLLLNLFSVIFRREWLKGYVRELLGYIALAAVECALCVGVCRMIDSENLLLTLALRLAVCGIIPNLVSLLIFRGSELFHLTVELLDGVTGYKLRFLTEKLERKKP